MKRTQKKILSNKKVLSEKEKNYFIFGIKTHLTIFVHVLYLSISKKNKYKIKIYRNKEG